jgi:hypothetical protein
MHTLSTRERAELEKLRKKLKAGKITVAQAQRLAELQKRAAELTA